MFLKKLNGAIALAIAGVMMFTPAINMVNAMEITGDETKNIYSEYIGNDSVDIEILEDNEEVRVAKSIVNGVESIATFNKIENILTIEENGEKIIMDMNQITNETDDPSDESETNPYVIIEEKTYSNYEYRFDTAGTTWILRRPKPGAPLQINSKSVTQTSSNKTNLNNFKKAVDEINSLEGMYIFYGGAASITTVVAIVANAVTAGTAAGAGLAALGLTGQALDCALKLERQQKNAYQYYFSV